MILFVQNRQVFHQLFDVARDPLSRARHPHVNCYSHLAASENILKVSLAARSQLYFSEACLPGAVLVPGLVVLERKHAFCDLSRPEWIDEDSKIAGYLLQARDAAHDDRQLAPGRLKRGKTEPLVETHEDKRERRPK